MTVTAFSSPAVEFGPLVLARPLWALLLLHGWQLIGHGPAQRVVRLVHRSRAVAADDLHRNRSVAAAGRIRACDARGRRTLMSFDPLFALLVIAVLALPYLVWLIRADTLAAAALAGDRDLRGRGAALGCIGRRACWWAISGIVLLVAVNSGWFGRNPEERRSSIGRRSIRLALDFVYFVAIAPALAGSLISACSILIASRAGPGLRF